MRSLIDELKLGACDDEYPLKKLLRMLRLLAIQIEDHRTAQWTKKELEGYEPQEQLPPYRTIRADIKVARPRHGIAWPDWESVSERIPQEHHPDLLRYDFYQSVSEISGFLDADRLSNSFSHEISTKDLSVLSKVLREPGLSSGKVIRSVRKGMIQRVLENVRLEVSEAFFELEPRLSGSQWVASEAQPTNPVSITGGNNQIAIGSANLDQNLQANRMDTETPAAQLAKSPGPVED